MISHRLGQLSLFPCHTSVLVYSEWREGGKTKEKTVKMDSFLQKHHCYYDLNTDWCIDLLKYCGPKEFKEFLALIKKLKWDDDLTYDNVGYKDGHPIIIDFSGFRE